MWVKFSIYIVPLFFLFSCSSEKGTDPQHINLLDNEYTLRYPELRHSDSLFLFFRTEEALSSYDKLLRTAQNDTIKRYAATRLSEIKHQYLFMYDAIDDVDTSLLISDLCFYRWLRLDRSMLTMDMMKERLMDAKFLSDSLKLLVQLSMYNDEVYDREDVEYTIGMVREGYDIIKDAPPFSTLHFDVFTRLSSVLSYERQNLLGCGIMNDAIIAIKDVDSVDSRFLAELHLERSFKILSSNDFFDQAYYDLDTVAQIMKEKPCSTASILSRVGKLYGCSVEQRNREVKSDSLSALVNEILQDLKELKNTCSPCRVNVDRIIAQTYYYNQEYNQAYPILLAALEYENRSIFKRGSQLETLLYMLSTVYENEGKYYEALNTYYENKVVAGTNSYNFNSLLNSDLKGNDFVTLLRFAEIHYSAWEKTSSEHDLNVCIDLLNKCEEVMNKELTMLDDNALLNYFVYQHDIYDRLSKGYLDKLAIGRDVKLNTTKAIENLSKMKNMILAKELFQANDENYLSESIRSEQKQLTFSLEAQKQKGVVGNKGLSSVLWKMYKLTERFEKNKGKGNIDAFQLKNRLNLEAIKGKLNNRQSLLSYHMSNEMLIIVHLSSSDEEIIVKDINESDKRLLDTYISMTKNPGSDIDSFQILAYDISQMLIPKELHSKLGNEVLVIPDDRLYYLSFDALIDHKTEDPSDWSDLDYLTSHYEFHYLFSDQFVKEDWNMDFTEQGVVDVLSFSSEASLDEEGEKTYLSELPFSISECEYIDEYLSSTKVSKHYAADKRTFLQVLESNRGYVHVSTHGSTNVNSQKDSKLYFRNKDLTLDSLYAYELLQIDMSPKLVFLATCQSGSGKVVKQEGLYGFKRFFLEQGVDHVITSLWDVNDRSGFLFTKSLLNNNFNVSLAKREFLQANKKKSHPYYWAGFVD